MKILFSGSSGFIGQYLRTCFNEAGYHCIEIPRNYLYDSAHENKLDNMLSQSDVLINLRGASITRRWTKTYKHIIYDSRIKTTNALVNSIARTGKSDLIFISTSAVGIYKPNKHHTDESNDYADNFLAKISLDWESAALKAASCGARVVIFRSGIVIGSSGGIVKKLKPLYSIGLGAMLLPYDAFFPWIHIHDWFLATDFVIKNQHISGIYNLVANTSTQKDFANALAKKFRSPILISIPKFALKSLVGNEAAQAIIYNPSVESTKLKKAGFIFTYSSLSSINF